MLADWKMQSALGVLLSLSSVALAAPPVANFTLPDATGKPWTLREQKAPVLVVTFISCECPMANAYLPVLADLERQFRDSGVCFVAINPCPAESAEQIRQHARSFQVPFPVLRDERQQAVEKLQARVTPEVFVLDAERLVRYRGRIDDGYQGRNRKKARVTRQDLKVALEEILAGKAVTVASTEAWGCPIPEPTGASVSSKPGSTTFYRDVLPVLQTHCQSCHRPNQVGPFSLLTYEQTSKWMDTCLEEIKARRMPPWKPAKNVLLHGERTIPDDAVRKLEQWVAQGKPAGDPKEAPAPRTFADGWTLGVPDLVLEAPGDMIVDAQGRDLFRVMVLPTNLPEDRYIVAMEVRPGNARVVHHTLQLIDTTGKARRLQEEAQARQKPSDRDRGPGYTVAMGWGFFPDRTGMLGGWAPGLLPKPLPQGVGQRLPKGADICIQYHYHRTGKVEKDRTKIGLYFAKAPVTDQFRTIPVPGLFLRIPAGDKQFKVESSWRLTEDVQLYRMTPHMHLLGKEIELTATLPSGKQTTLIHIPSWDYNWQEQYELKEPLRLPKGTVLRVRATFDNSADNPNNPSDPPQSVRLGEQTTNEMCFVFLGISTTSKSVRLLSPARGGADR